MRYLTQTGSAVPTSTSRRRNSPSLLARVRAWELWRQSPLLIAVLLSVELLALGCAVAAFLHVEITASSLLRLGLLLVLGLGFEACALKVGRLRYRLIRTGYVDMTSVWQFAAAIALQQAYAVVLVVVLRVYLAVREQGDANAYRQVLNGAATALTCQAGATMMALTRAHVAQPLQPAAVVAVGIVTFTVVNRGLVYGAICLSRGSFDLSLLVGTWDDNGLETATLFLGGLAGVALIHDPVLAALAVLPTFVLQRGALVKELELAASQDAKTGLLNAIAWQHLAKRELSRAQREKKTATILIVDLDHFKSVNDDFGHVLGDAALRGVGDCLRGELRDYDTVGRFGGEEFVAVLPDVDEMEAALIAERLRERIAATSIASFAAHSRDPEFAAASDKTLSTSIGVACYPEHGTELEQLLVAADSALYRAKDRGRNRVEFAGTDARGTSGIAVMD
jgi:diguanylate cyclase (GGDEF)-like protein